MEGGFLYLYEDVTCAPVWLRFEALPHEYWQEDILLDLAKCFGTPLLIDKFTLNMEKGKFARVCVELDLTKPLKSGRPYRYSRKYVLPGRLLRKPSFILREDWASSWKLLVCGRSSSRS